MRLALMYSGVFTVAALVPPPPYHPGRPGDGAARRTEQRAGAEPRPVPSDPSWAPPAQNAGGWSVLIPPPSREPVPGRPARELDLAALGLAAPRKSPPGAVPKGGPRSAADALGATGTPRTTAVAPEPAPPAPATVLADLRARLPTPAAVPRSGPVPATKLPELNLAALGLIDPRRPADARPGGGVAPPMARPRAPIPSWWRELDTDSDGQVDLSEWRRAGRAAADFEELDLNADGLLTADEYRRATAPAREPKLP